MLFPANTAVEQGVIVSVIMIALFIFTLLRFKKTRVQSTPVANLLQDTDYRSIGLQNLRAWD